MVFAHIWSLGPVSLSHCVESHIWSLPIYGLWVWFPCPNCVESYGLWVRFPCPTALNPIYGLCPYMVFAHIWSLGLVSLSQLCWILWSLGLVSLSHTVLNPIYGLCRYMVFGSGFPVPTVLNPMVFGSGFLVPHCVESHIWSLPIYGLRPYMVFAHIWSLGRFPCPNCVESYCLWVRFPCPTALNPIYGLCPYMVFGSGFPVPTVLDPMVFGSGFLVPHCVESHIWSLPIYGLWVWFPCLNCVESYGLCFRFPCPTALNPIWSLPIYGLRPYMVFAHIWFLGLVSLSQLC